MEMIPLFSLFISLISVSVAMLAMRKATALNQVSLWAAAADRALQRFSRFNEILFRDLSLHDVFLKPFDQIDAKSQDHAKAFVWFVLNQMEGVYMDYHLGLLAPESFECYDKWFKAKLMRSSALRDFLMVKEGKYRDYFARPYRAYFEAILSQETAQVLDREAPNSH